MNWSLFRKFSANRLVMVCLLLAGLLSSCQKENPDILSDSDMEDLLFDYHLTKAIVYAQNLDSLQAQPYLKDVFRKHHVNQHIFDENMAYYLRHAERLNDIYSHLVDRMKNEARKQGIDETGMMIAEAGGDNVNVWTKDNFFMMRELPPYNLVSNTIRCDTTFHPGDKLVLSCHTDFLYEDGSRNGIMVLSVKFKNDSTVTRTTMMLGPSTYQINISDDTDLGFKEVKCYFIDRQSNNPHDRVSSTMRLMALSDIKLIVMHKKKDNDKDKENEKTDSTADTRPEPQQLRPQPGMH